MPANDLLERARQALAQGQSALGAIARALAVSCGEKSGAGQDGRLSDQKLTRYQSEGFRLAQCHSQLFAAQELLEFGRRGQDEARLAAAFAGLTLAELQHQLPHMTLHLEGVPDSVRELPGSRDIADLVRQTSGGPFHAGVLESLERQRTAGADGLSQEHRLLRETFRAFAERKVRPQAEAIHRQDRLIPEELIREASQLGCFGLSIPQAYGGVQDRPDNLGMVVVTEELCRGALIVGSLITRPEILAKALLKGGTEEQRRRFLPPMASGEKMVAISVTEPDFGSDVARIACAARPHPGGWLLNGAKLWCTFGGRAELIGLLARTEPDPALGYRGLSMFVVEKPAFQEHDFEHRQPGGGKLTGRAIGTLGYRGMHSYELHFEDYFVPAENLVGGPAGQGKGFTLQMEGFAYGRLQTAGRALGLMQAALDAALDYARTRVVFGKPLLDFPLTQEKLARMAATTAACRQAVYTAARQLDAAPQAPQSQIQASLVKFFACRQAEWITREAQQLHGGMGYAEEFPVSRWFVDARVLSIFEGAEEVLALRVILPDLLKPYLR